MVPGRAPRERQVATTRVRAATAAGVGALCGPRPSACCQSRHGIVCLVCLPVASLRHLRLIRPKCKRGACLTPGLPCLEWAACRDARRLDGTRVRALRPVCAARGGRGCRRPSRARAPAAGCFRGTSSTTLDRAGVRVRKAGGLRPAGSRPVHATLPGARCHARTFIDLRLLYARQLQSRPQQRRASLLHLRSDSSSDGEDGDAFRQSDLHTLQSRLEQVPYARNSTCGGSGVLQANTAQLTRLGRTPSYCPSPMRRRRR